MRVWKAANPEKMAEDRRRANERHQRLPHERRATKLRLSFGMSLEQYAALEAKQGGLCAICERPEHTIDRRANRPRHLAVDHCHETGDIRGLLCGDCNRSLGMMKEDIGALHRMISYLARHSALKKVA